MPTIWWSWMPWSTDAFWLACTCQASLVLGMWLQQLSTKVWKHRLHQRSLASWKLSSKVWRPKSSTPHSAQFTWWGFLPNLLLSQMSSSKKLMLRRNRTWRIVKGYVYKMCPREKLTRQCGMIQWAWLGNLVNFLYFLDAPRTSPVVSGIFGLGDDFSFSNNTWATTFGYHEDFSILQKIPGCCKYVCNNLCHFFPTKNPYQKADILDIWKIQVFFHYRCWFQIFVSLSIFHPYLGKWSNLDKYF